MNRYVAAVMVAVVLMLTGLGLVMISSTTAPLADSSGQLKKQLIWLAGSLVVFGVMAWVDYKVWRPFAVVLFAACIVALLFVFVPKIGGQVKGAYRWLNLFGFKVQPSEFLRLAIVLLLASHLAKNQTKIREWKNGFLWPMGIILIPLILLRMEPDLGTMILVAITALIMMFVAGSRLWPLIASGGAGVLMMLAMLWMIPERRARLLAFLNPEEHKDGKGFQIYQGMLAFGSGGTQGLGLGNSRQKMFYLPESTTDSIFPIIGEELGFYVTLGVVLAYAIILICGFWISLNSREPFGMLLGIGLVSGLCIQAMVNIGTVTGSIPPKGMPLPFVSYGGSNLMISFIVIGILVSIHRQSLRVKHYSAGIPVDDKTPRI